MLHHVVKYLSDIYPVDNWDAIDTWIVITAALAAMACALPGVFLTLRKQSMMGDALSHTSLLGIVGSLLLMNYIYKQDWISKESLQAWQHVGIFAGAVAIGIFTSLAAEWVRRHGRVDSSAALGVVFTSLFALSLLIIRLKADAVHIDADCVLYGSLETSVMNTMFDSHLSGREVKESRFSSSSRKPNSAPVGIPAAAVTNAVVLLLNLGLLLLFFKELKITAFDPELATSLGINARLIGNLLMAVTAVTLVAAFESVGSILVIAMLVVPSATAYLLSDRLHGVIAISLLVAAIAALAGHTFAITVPPVLFRQFDNAKDLNASTPGMMAVAAGLLFTMAALFGPRHGILSKVLTRLRLTLRIVGEDILGMMYRLDEGTSEIEQQSVSQNILQTTGVSSLMVFLATTQLRWRGLIASSAEGLALTSAGKSSARDLVRAHRLWESYMSEHFLLPGDHLHGSAAAVEHYLTPEMRAELSLSLEQAATDPHGRNIPPESSNSK